MKAAHPIYVIGIRQIKVALVSCLALFTLTSCGGGSGGNTSSTVASTLSFPLQSGLRASVVQGSSTNYTVSGAYSGTASTVDSAPTVATFENTQGFSVVTTTTINIPSINLNIFDSATDYFDSNYSPLGTISANGSVSKFLTSANTPASVKVGDKGVIGTTNNYTDSTKTTLAGYDDISYVIEADTADTAIVNIVNKSYTTLGTLDTTEQNRYRIAASGLLTRASTDLQFKDSGGTPVHLILTPMPDTTPPRLVSVSPANNATDVSVFAPISATFNEIIDASTVNAMTFTLNSGSSAPVSGLISYSGTTATLTPSARLASNSVYTATITTGIHDLAGNALASNFSWTFTTALADMIPPTVLTTSPNNLATDVALSGVITINFSEVMDAATVTSAEFTVLSGITPVAGLVSCNGTTAIFTPTQPFTKGKLITATISTGAKDLSGNALASNFSWSFTTVLPDLIPPVVLSVSPNNLTADVALSSAITVSFSEVMDAATITSAEFTLMDGTTPVAGLVSYAGTAATFQPSARLIPNKVYTATITTGAKDLEGNSLLNGYSWSFTAKNVLFETVTTIPSGSSINAVAIGDVNSDGRNDVIVTTTDVSHQSIILVYLQNATGSLGFPSQYATTSFIGEASVSIGDVNNDGKNDVVVGSPSGLNVFLQSSNGLLNQAVLYPLGNALATRIADLNNDGRLDVVGVGLSTGMVSIWFQNASGTLNAPIIYNDLAAYKDFEVGDVNNDGLTDIILVSGLNVGIITQASGGGLNTPTYYDGGTITNGGGTVINTINYVAVGDVNGDHLDDVVIAFYANQPESSVGIFLQNTLGTLNSMVKHPAHYTFPLPIEIADVSGDGLKDVVVLHGYDANSGVGLFQQLPNGTLSQVESMNPTSFSSLGQMVIGDINGDGKNDIVIASGVYGLVVLYHY